MKTVTIDGIEYQLTPVTKETPEPVKWEPNRVDVGKSYYAMDRLHDIFSSVEDGHAVDAHYSDRGNYFHSKQEGCEAAKQVRQLLRLRAYVREFAPDYKPDWGNLNEQKWYTHFDEGDNKWFYTNIRFMRTVTTVYMPKNVAKELTHKLNNGEVVL